jgi:hypothetical protein
MQELVAKRRRGSINGHLCPSSLFSSLGISFFRTLEPKSGLTTFILQRCNANRNRINSQQTLSANRRFR